MGKLDKIMDVALLPREGAKSKFPHVHVTILPIHGTAGGGRMTRVEMLPIAVQAEHSRRNEKMSGVPYHRLGFRALRSRQVKDSVGSLLEPCEGFYL